MVDFKKILTGFIKEDVPIVAYPDGVILLNQQGEFLWFNDVAQKMFEELKPQFEQFSIDDILDNAMGLILRIADGEKSSVVRTKSSLEKDMFFELSARKTEEGIVVTMRDTTQSYKTLTSILVEHESSKKVNRDKNNFLVKLSNDFKAPLQSIVGFSQAMIDGMGGSMSEKQEKYVGIINKNSTELLYFIDKILELSKTESNLFQREFELFDAVNTVQNIIKINEQVIKEKNISVKIELEDTVKRTVYSDETLLKIILQNIIEIAIKMTDVGSVIVKIEHPDLEVVNERGLIPFENASEKSFLLFNITDTGIGISNEEMETLFEPYAQLDSQNRKNLTRSIAFASIRNVIKMLKGNMWVDSEPMQGSSYNVIIPTEKVIQSINE